MTFRVKSWVFFQDFLPISKNTIKETLLLLKALFRSEAGFKDLKNMHKKPLSGAFRHFAWMEPSKSEISNYLHEFAAILSAQNICEQAVSCFILTRRTSLTLGILTFKTHVLVTPGFWFACLCLGWPQPCCLQNSSTPTSFAAFHRAQLWYFVGAGQAHPWRFWGHSATAFWAACPTKCFVNASCSTAKLQSAQKKSSAHLQLKEVFRWEDLPGQELHVCTDVRAYLLTFCINNTIGQIL